MSFAQKIKELRNGKSWSVYDLAERINKTAGYISKIEVRGEIPGADTIIKLAVVFGVKADELFGIVKQEKTEQFKKGVNKKYDDALKLYQKSKEDDS